MGKRKRSDVNPKHRWDGKTKDERSAAARQAATTRKANVSKARGNMMKFSLEIPVRFLKEFEELVVKPGSYSSTSEAIRVAMRQYAGIK